MKKIGIGICIFLLFILGGSTYGNQNIEGTDFFTGYVNTELLNVRQGPSTEQAIIETLNKNETVDILAKIEDWYIVKIPSGKVGCVSSEYIQEKVEEIKGEIEAGITEITELENKVIGLINEKRKENNLPELIIDDELQNIARLKAKEMVEKGYFSHTSPEYGTPFEMISKMGVEFKVVGENIAGNVNEEEAVNAWINSEGHKENILNNSYNYTGIGIANSSKYGKIFVQMFIGK